MAAACIVEIPWRQIRPQPGQPRVFFDQAALRELADSIAAVGQMVPIQACPVPPDGRGHTHEIVDGERRWRAVQLAGVATLRAEIVDEPDPERRFRRSVVANFARQANHPLEVSAACLRLRATMSVDQIAAMLGKSNQYIYNHLSLQDLHPDLRDMLAPDTPRAARLPLSSAFRLARLPRETQVEAMQEAGRRDASTGRAYGDAIDAIEPLAPGAAYRGTGRRERHRAPSDHFKALRALVRGGNHTLDRLDDPAVRHMLAGGRDPAQTAKVREGLDRLIAHLARVRAHFGAGAGRG